MVYIYAKLYHSCFSKSSVVSNSISLLLHEVRLVNPLLHSLALLELLDQELLIPFIIKCVDCIAFHTLNTTNREYLISYQLYPLP